MPPPEKKKRDKPMNVDLLCKMAEKELECRITTKDGTKLEARTANLKGGSVAVAASLAGYCTVRFNFRGVGASEGATYFRSPLRECEDVRDVARWLHASRKHHGLPPLESVWILGVSYGSAIGAAAAGLFDEFAGYVAVSYPASYLWYCCNLQGETYLNHARCAKPKLFLWGDVDVFAGKKVMRDVYASMPEPKEKASVATLDAAFGHYFRSKEHLKFLNDKTLAWFKKNAPTLPPRTLEPPPSPPKPCALPPKAPAPPAPPAEREGQGQAQAPQVKAK
ncbi:C2 domain-containing protein [Aureococcus anophagefferens]|nr:C2 domain-containing protein [Aureococcus anophagefferens]